MSEQELDLDQCVKMIIAEFGIDPYSRKFIFGNDDRNTRLRNQPVKDGQNRSVPMLRAMLRYGLEDHTKRVNLFPKSFHLGSHKKIPEEQLKLTALATTIRIEKGKLDDIATRKKEFESITDALKEITGNRFNDYDDKQNSIRVIYLLGKMMKNQNKLPRKSAGRTEAFEERDISVLAFIKTPTTRFSFETRDAYPIAESISNTYLLNDLKAYIGIEIDIKTLENIDSIFDLLIGRINHMREHLDKVAYKSGKLRQILDSYRILKRMVDDIQIADVSDNRLKAIRLDHDLYLHLNRLEFLHFAGEYGNILAEAEPPSQIMPVKSEMIEAFSTIANRKVEYFNITEKSFQLIEFQKFSIRYADKLLPLLEKAIGLHLREPQYIRIIMLSEELLYRRSVFGATGPILRKNIHLSFKEAFGALCAVAQALEHRTTYRPYVFGDNSQTRSIITPLECSIDFEELKPPKEIPEGYLQLWHHRLEWVMAALEGTHDIAESKFELRKALFTKTIECLKMKDIVLVEAALSNLEIELSKIRPENIASAGLT